MKYLGRATVARLHESMEGTGATPVLCQNSADPIPSGFPRPPVTGAVASRSSPFPLALKANWIRSCGHVFDLPDARAPVPPDQSSRPALAGGR